MRRPEPDPEYLLTFSSFYKAVYGRDKLKEQGIDSVLKRVPTQLLRSCGQALYISGYDLRSVLAVLSESQIDTKGVYQVIMTDDTPEYRKIR
ncbi:DUF3343 domain-containing protein [bacterium 210820-DFI.6.37]|nr:DUF3343 domain-containing protein [bacterium 210820-DFI.6.37]